MHGLSVLIAKELAMASNKIDNYKSTIDELEEKIDKEKYNVVPGMSVVPRVKVK